MAERSRFGSYSPKKSKSLLAPCSLASVIRTETCVHMRTSEGIDKTMRFTRVFLLAVFALSIQGWTRSQGPIALPSAKEAIARMEALAAVETDIVIKTALKGMAADLRKGCQQGKIKRDWGPGGLGPNTPGETLGDDGKKGGALAPGWGPKQILFIGDEALQILTFNVCKSCVRFGPLTEAAKMCFMKDVTWLTMVHELTHVQQRTPVPYNPTEALRLAIECEAYKNQCAMTLWLMTEKPKYGVALGVLQPGCTLGRLMLMQWKQCKLWVGITCV